MPLLEIIILIFTQENIFVPKTVVVALGISASWRQIPSSFLILTHSKFPLLFTPLNDLENLKKRSVSAARKQMLRNPEYSNSNGTRQHFFVTSTFLCLMVFNWYWHKTDNFFKFVRKSRTKQFFSFIYFMLNLCICNMLTFQSLMYYLHIKL